MFVLDDEFFVVVCELEVVLGIVLCEVFGVELLLVVIEIEL